MRRLVTSLRARATLLALAVGVLAAMPTPVAHAAPGDLDPQFGQGGSERIFPSEESIAVAAVAVQPDDKIVLAGEEDRKVLVARLLPDGSLDPSFGNGGKVVTPVGNDARARDVGSSPTATSSSPVRPKRRPTPSSWPSATRRRDSSTLASELSAG
jgi:hypothetical protein